MPAACYMACNAVYQETEKQRSVQVTTVILQVFFVLFFPLMTYLVSPLIQESDAAFLRET